MTRIKTDILHFKQGKSHDKVYIVEVIEDNQTFHVYANYGKRMQKNLIRQLKLTTEHKHEAIDEFDNLLRKKVREGYKTVADGTKLEIPGFKPLLKQTEVVVNLRNNMHKIEHEVVVEHRRLLL